MRRVWGRETFVSFSFKRSKDSMFLHFSMLENWFLFLLFFHGSESTEENIHRFFGVFFWFFSIKEASENVLFGSEGLGFKVEG